MNVSAISTKANHERMTRMGLLTEPAGYVDGQNLYQFVTSNPLNEFDPLGLEGASISGDKHDKFSGEITLPDGSQATVEIFTNAKIDYGDGRSMKNGIGFQVTSEKGTCEKCHFIQFVRVYRVDKEGKDDTSIFDNTSTFKRYGSWYLDVTWENPTSVWYDTNDAHIRENNRLGRYDFPNIPTARPDDVRRGQEFQTFLVCDGKVKWKWTWKRERVKGEDGKWREDAFTPTSGAAATDLGDFKDMDKFPLGYTDANGKKPVPPYANPLK